MLYLAGIGIALFLGLLLFTKKNKSAADTVLAAWLVVIAFHLFQYYLFITGKVFHHPAHLGAGIPLPLLHGPFLYIYVSNLTCRGAGRGYLAMLHFLPAAFSYLYLAPFMLRPAAEKIAVFRNNGEGYETFIVINTAAIFVSGIVYVTASVLLLRRHRRAILDEFSCTDKIDLDWIRFLILGIALIWIFVLAGNDTYIYSTAVLFVVFIGFFGIRQVGIFTSHEHPLAPEEPPLTEEQPRKYSKSGLSDDAATRLHNELTAFMSREKAFREADLSLVSLAERLNTIPNYLSQVINEKEGKNFYDYVNTLRIEEFIQSASDPSSRKLTLLGLAFDNGFNSKSSFNKYFRKVTGQSPSEYLKNTSQS